MHDAVYVALGDVADLLAGFPFRSTDYADGDAGVRLLRGDNIGQGQLRWEGTKRWPSTMLKGLETYALRKGDVVLAMDRPWIEAGLKYAYVQDEDLPALLVQRVARLRGTEQLDNRFLRYVIGSRAFTQHVLAVQTGTAVPHISGAQIKSFRFALPGIGQQQRVIAVLGALDDKIALNAKTNATLEAMARAVFEDWFVRFGPVRAKAEGRAPPSLTHDLAALFPGRLTESPSGKELNRLNRM